MDINNLWQKALPILEDTLSQVMYDSIMKHITPISFENGILTLKTHDDFHKPTIMNRYIHDMTRAVRSLTTEDVDIFIISPEDLKQSKGTRELKHNYEKSNLRQRYTFETFVPGKCNELAYAGARAVAETPGKAEGYNPLFLYGGVGLGKTHLIHAIGNQVLDHYPDYKVMYVSSDAFTNEFITAIRDKNAHEFKKKYRNVDVLLIDDVQFLAGKIETQEEMFHTFNTLYGEKKQIVITSDVPPRDLKELENRLTSRFASGLTTDVSMPDYETRTAILDKKLYLEKQEFPSQVKDFIIRNVVSNIRDLEGALNKVMAYARLTKATITLELAEVALKDLLVGIEKPDITMDYIQEVVANHFKITKEDMNGRKRTQAIVLPRQIAMYLCRKILDFSLPDVGKFFGGRDHTTVIHSCEKIAGELETDEKLKLIVEDLEIKIKGE
ncbi:MAG: chromosomal replication initiator protein DnaA [Defluviitaleaceae bacterium]|nr:chromosomal replication initiator protein DnaA [Defluviitaleaceae bacterium]